MADTWQQLTGRNSEDLQGLSDALVDPLSTIVSVLDGISKALDILSAMFSNDNNPMQDILQAAVDAVYQTILDTLQTNVAMCVHANLEFDTDWKYDPNYTVDSSLPWKGTGIETWLAQIKASAYDPTDPFRPLTDDETEVAGVILLKGASSFSQVSALKKLYDLVFPVRPWWDRGMDVYGDGGESYSALGRLGSIVHSTVCKSIADVIPQSTITDTYINGDYPMWRSIPLASIFPGVGQFYGALTEMVSSIMPASDNPLARQAATLARKAEILSDAADRISSLLVSLDETMSWLDDVYMLVLDMDAGGMDGFVDRALAADDLPSFGAEGIVYGTVLVATKDDAWNHLQSFIETVFGTDGILDDYSDGQTARAEALSDTFDDIMNSV